MTVSSRALVELVLLGPTNDRRQLQDSPVLGDVWIAYAMKPADAIDLLITPHKSQAAGPVAVRISKRLSELGMKRGPGQSSQIAYLQGLVAARLFFEELMRVIVPMTSWWHDRKEKNDLKKYKGDSQLDEMIQAVIDWTRAKTEDEQIRASSVFAAFNSLDRYVSLAAIILWAATEAIKAPHHGSDRNADPILFRRVTADHYVFSGNGEHGNPERATLQMLLDERGEDDDFTIHLTYPIDEIDVGRKEDWAKEQAKERARKKKNPKVEVRPNWSAKKNSLAAFFAAHKKFADKVVIVPKDEPHVIDLLDKM